MICITVYLNINRKQRHFSLKNDFGEYTFTYWCINYYRTEMSLIMSVNLGQLWHKLTLYLMNLLINVHTCCIKVNIVSIVLFSVLAEAQTWPMEQ